MSNDFSDRNHTKSYVTPYDIYNLKTDLWFIKREPQYYAIILLLLDIEVISEALLFSKNGFNVKRRSNVITM